MCQRGTVVAYVDLTHWVTSLVASMRVGVCVCISDARPCNMRIMKTQTDRAFLSVTEAGERIGVILGRPPTTS